MKKVKAYLKERWKKVTYSQLLRFYYVTSIVTLITFPAAVLDNTGWHPWKIVPVILMTFWLVSLFLYYEFENVIKEKEKSEERDYKEKVKEILSHDETIEIKPKVLCLRKKESLSKIFLDLKKQLKSSECRMEAYLDEKDNIILLFFVNNTFDGKFKYSGISGYKSFLREWKIK